jgi:TfoX/Sxy family transcriptional regulator of competence genes
MVAPIRSPYPTGREQSLIVESWLMAYDAELADRVRRLVDGAPALSERRMFGGLAFLVHGNMAVAASGEGGLLVRVDPEQSAELLASSPATPMEMRGRSLAGWLRVASEDVVAERELASWVERGLSYARSLPPKR